MNTRELIEECRAALAEELSSWDIDPPLHHVKQAHDKCVAWLAAAPPPPPAQPVQWAQHAERWPVAATSTIDRPTQTRPALNDWIENVYQWIESTCPPGSADEAFRVAPQEVREAITAAHGAPGDDTRKRSAHQAAARQPALSDEQAAFEAWWSMPVLEWQRRINSEPHMVAWEAWEARARAKS